MTGRELLVFLQGLSAEELDIPIMSFNEEYMDYVELHGPEVVKDVAGDAILIFQDVD